MMPSLGYSGIWGVWFNHLSPPPSLLIPQVEPDENPSSELLERREGMTGEQILRCWGEEQHWDGAVSPGGLCLSCPLFSWKSGELPTLAEPGPGSQPTAQGSVCLLVPLLLSPFSGHLTEHILLW